MGFIVLALSFFISSPWLHALPLGHESGVMGNTSSRPGDVGSILQYPSALAFEKDNSTRLYSGLMFYQLRISAGSGFDSSVDNAFVPYFTASTFTLGSYKLASFAQYSEDFTARFSLNDQDTGFTGRTDVSGDKLELGFSMSRKIKPQWAIGATASVILANQKVIAHAEGQVGGNDFLQISNSQSNTIHLRQIVSISHSTEKHFFSISAFSPTLRFSSDGQQEVRTLISTQQPLVSQSDFEPEERDPWSLGVGYSLRNSIFKPSFDLRYFLPDSYTQVVGSSAVNSSGLQFDGYFRAGAGGEIRIGATSIMVGFNYTQKRIEKNIGANESEIYLGTLGVRIKSLESHPIVGIYYEVDRQDVNQNVDLIGLMYSTNYNL